MYYERDRMGVPHRWIGIVKEAIKTVAPTFSACRMMREYAQQMYLPAASQNSQNNGLEGKNVGTTG